MPHVIVKLASGRSEAQKSAIAEAVTKAIVAAADVGEDAVSVAIDDIPQAEWVERVYRPDILPILGTLYKQPGYDPLNSGFAACAARRRPSIKFSRPDIP